MKLSRIPGAEPTVKHSFSFRRSTSNNLQAYFSYYLAETGAEGVSIKDVAEQILQDFMAEDKGFQRYLRQAQLGTPSTPAPEAKPTASEVTAELSEPGARVADLGSSDAAESMFGEHEES